MAALSPITAPSSNSRQGTEPNGLILAEGHSMLLALEQVDLQPHSTSIAFSARRHADAARIGGGPAIVKLQFSGCLAKSDFLDRLGGARIIEKLYYSISVIERLNE